MKVKIINENYPDWIWETRNDPRSPVYDGPYTELEEKYDYCTIEFKFKFKITDNAVDIDDEYYDEDEKFISDEAEIKVDYDDYMDALYAIWEMNDVDVDKTYEAEGIIQIPIEYTTYDGENYEDVHIKPSQSKILTLDLKEVK